MHPICITDDYPGYLITAKHAT